MDNREKVGADGVESMRDDSPVNPDERARDLLSQLTLEEKLSMMDGDVPFWPGLSDMTGGGYADHTWNAGVNPRLGIPGIRFADGPRGAVLEGATTFPVTMARGATWDIELEERVGEIIGIELRALGANFFGGVCINLLRHPAWGRAQETYGEDPVHLGEMGAALVRGVQKHAMACVKHFAVNSMENARFKLDVRLSERALREIYLPHFRRVIEEKPAAVMSAYNSVNGEWCGQNAHLLTDILKNDWGFDGFVISDFIFGLRDAKKAVLAGLDVEMPFQMLFHQALKGLVEAGEVPSDRIDDAVLRILRQQLRLVKPASLGAALAGCDEYRKVAREVARKSIVLLKNQKGLLPLQGFDKLAVIGRLADYPNTGDTASSSTRPAHVVTPLEGFQTALDGSDSILYDDGSDIERAVATARQADRVVLVVGYTHEDEGEFIDSTTVQDLARLFPDPSPDEAPLAKAFLDGLTGEQVGSFPPGGDRDRLTLRQEDEHLIEAIASANENVIVAVVAGSAVIMERWRDRVPAIVMLWYPGMEGGHALADVVLGRVNPSGKLPFVIPRRAEDLPTFDKEATEFEYDLWHGYRLLDRDAVEPAFPFGFGLSYTTFRYDDLRLGASRGVPSDFIPITLTVSNAGLFSGDEIVQLYISPVESRVERAPKELKSFTRVHLDAGESKSVELLLPLSRLAYYDESEETFVVEEGAYDIILASHSADPKALNARITVAGGMI